MSEEVENPAEKAQRERLVEIAGQEALARTRAAGGDDMAEERATRSERAYRMLGAPNADDAFDAIVDAVTDLLHCADDYGTAGGVIARAEMHYTEEGGENLD